MKNTKEKIIKYWSWPLLYALLIFGLSSIRTPHVYELKNFNIDKLLHLVEYFGLALVLSRSFLKATSLKRSIIFWSIIAFGSIIAMSDEFYQSFVPGRQSSVYDFMADVIGVAVGTWVYLRKAKHDKS